MHKTAILVLTRTGGAKLQHLVAELRLGQGYDLFVCADETAGPCALEHLPEDVGVIRHSAAGAPALGLAASVPGREHGGAGLLWFFGDYAFYASAVRAPDYDHYVLLDEKIAFTRDNALFIEGLCHRLTGDAAGPYDLVTTWLGERGSDWLWYAAAAAAFPSVHGMFSPLVALSRRALAYLFEWRRSEAAGSAIDPARARPVFWEALLPSALVAGGGFRCDDVNRLIPHGWAADSFPAAQPILLGSLPARSGAECVYPVAAEREYLAWLLEQARKAGTVADLIGRLAPGGDLAVSENARIWFLRQALETLTES